MASGKRTYVLRDFEMTFEEIRKGWKMPFAHFHSHYEIYILLSGERTVTIGDSSYPTVSGNTALFPMETPHQSRGDTDFSGICIHFSPDFLNRYLRAGTVKNLMACFSHPVIPLPQPYLQELKKQAEHFDRKSPYNYLLLAAILARLNEYSHTCAEAAESPAQTGTRQEEILQYLDTHYTTIGSVAEVSSALGVSDAYVYRCVKALSGMTPKQYINRLRIRNAMRDLEYGNKNLSVIQEVCGFHSASYFQRVFKQETGITPTQYRRQHRCPESRPR